jgi:hypothetical protein
MIFSSLRYTGLLIGPALTDILFPYSLAPIMTLTSRFVLIYWVNTQQLIVKQPVASCVSAEQPARYGPVLAGEHVSQRLKEMYF